MAENLSHSGRSQPREPFIEARASQPILQTISHTTNHFSKMAVLPTDSPVEIATRSHALHIQHDWIGSAYDSKSQETIIWLAALYGYPGQSQQISALMAGLFSECEKNRKDFFDTSFFLTELNFLLYRLGKGKWAIPLSGIRYLANRPSIDIFNCGQVNPSIFFPGKPAIKPEFTTGNTLLGPLGLHPTFKPLSLTTSFQAGGLIVARALPSSDTGDNWNDTFVNQSQLPLSTLLDSIAQGNYSTLGMRALR